MKKLLFLSAILNILAIPVFAQSSDNSNKFSVGLDLGNPFGINSKIPVIMLGASVKYTYPVNNYFAITGSAGFLTSVYKKTYLSEVKAIGIYNPGETFFPLKAGLNYYFLSAAGNNVYAEGQIGYVFPSGGGSSSGGVYALGIGYTFDFNVDVSFTYESWAHTQTTNQLLLRVAFMFH